MAPKRRRFAVLLGSLLFAASILSVPALATEEGGFVPYTENGDNGAIVFPTNPAPPTPTPEPTPTPTPVPTPTPTPVPTPEPTPVVDPTPSEDPDDPPYVPDNPTPSPSRRPNGGGTAVTPAPTPHPSNRPVPSEQPVVQRPSITPKPDGPLVSSPEAPDDGTNYVTFAQLNTKNNSLAIALFYGGLACAVLGVTGLIILLARFLRKRRRDEKEAIFREIEAAENRHHSAERIPSRMPELVTSPNHAPSAPRSGEGSPRLKEPVYRSQEHSPRQPSSSQGASHHLPHPISSEEEHLPSSVHRNPPRVSSTPPAYPVSATHPKTGPNAPIVPVQASMYTEEFSLPEEAPASAPKPQMASRLRQSAQRPAEKQASSEKSSGSSVSEPQVKPRKPETSEPPSPLKEAPKPVKPEPPAQKKTESPKQEYKPGKPQKAAASSSKAEAKPEKATEPSDAQIPGQMSLLD